MPLQCTVPKTAVVASVVLPRLMTLGAGKLGLDEPVSKYLPEVAWTTVLVATKGEDGEMQDEEVPTGRIRT